MLGRWCGVFFTVVSLFLQSHYASVIDLAKMLQYMTGRNPIDFINYGNWCGLGGSGYPLDEIDRCCKFHDFCYDKTSASTCLDEKPHLVSYKWKYAAGKIHCNKQDSPCGLSTCRCDGKFAACVQVHQASYDPRKKRKRTPILNLLSNALRSKK